MGADEEKLTDLSNDNIESDIGRNTDFDNEESFQGSPTREKLFNERFSSPTVIRNWLTKSNNNDQRICVFVMIF